MTNAEDQAAADRDRWAAIVAAESRGEPQRSEDAAHRRRFEGENPDAVSEEAWLWAGIGALGEPRGEKAELSDAALAERILAQVGARGGAETKNDAILEAPTAKVIPIGKPRARRGIAAAFAAIALAAALAALASEIMSSGPSGPAGDAAPSGAPAASGAGRLGHARGGAETPAEAPSAEAPADPALTADNAGNTADLKPTDAPSGIEGPGSGKAAEAIVRDGRAGSGGGAAHEAPRETPRETADSLLQSAQARLGEGKTQEAVAAYKDLLSRYPSSAEARAALISLGRLSLGGGSAEEALGYFDRYLAAGGPLSVEARYGRIQALHRLGRAGDEMAAIRDFLARHGESVYAPRLRERLSATPADSVDSAPASPAIKK